ncbi:hypothetical protein, partial [Methylomagnum sp.]
MNDPWTGNNHSWKRITGGDDFQHTAVYESNSPGSRGYRVEFKNWEYSKSDLERVFSGVLFFFGILTGMYIALILGGLGVILALIGLAVWYNKVKSPWSVKRAIELDMGADRIQVFNGGRMEIERKLSRMENLTVEDHPEAEFARMNRQQKGEKELKEVEKTHCLMGWFGVGGSEQVMLVTRAEWPCRHSLFEVRQAILWCIERARDDVTVTQGPDFGRPESD